MLRRLQHALCLLLIVVLTASCSMHLAYHNVDRLVAWRADDFLDLTREQRSFVMERVRYHRAWHREQELSRYRQFLDALEARIKDGVTAAEVTWFFEQLQGFKSTLMIAISADTAALLRSVSDKQREHLREALVKSNRKLEERVASGEAERRRRRDKEVIAEIEHWTGRLSRAQRERVVKELAKLPDMSAPWLAYKRERQQQLLTLLEQAQGNENFDAALQEWLLGSASARFAEYQQQVQQTAAVIDQLLTPAQRKHALDELRKLRETLVGLQDA